MSTLGNEAETRRIDGNVDGNIHNGLLPGQWRESAKCPPPLARLPGYSFRMRAPAAYLRMGAFKSPQTNDSDAGANDTVARQILRIRSEAIYSWSRKRQANISSPRDDLMRDFRAGTIHGFPERPKDLRSFSGDGLPSAGRSTSRLRHDELRHRRRLGPCPHKTSQAPRFNGFARRRVNLEEDWKICSSK